MQKIFREIKNELTLEHKVNIDFPAHVHDDIELVFVKNGGGTAFCDGKKYILQENSFFLVFPNQVHQYCDCSDGDYIVLIVKPYELLYYKDAFTEGTPASAVWQWEEKLNNNIPYLLETALYEYENDGHDPVIDAYLTALLGKLLKFFEINKLNQPNNTVIGILKYCSDHYKEQLTVGDVADALHISKSSVSHIFSTHLSINFCDYINSLRLSDAIKLLDNKKFSVTEVSYMSGFSTIRTFNRVFKLKYGITPTEYRAKR